MADNKYSIDAQIEPVGVAENTGGFKEEVRPT
jgi:hypothetical protein